MGRFSRNSFLFLSWFFFGFFSLAVASHFHPAGLSGRSCSLCEIKGTTEGNLFKVSYDGSIPINPMGLLPFPGLSSEISPERYFSSYTQPFLVLPNKSPPIAS